MSALSLSPVENCEHVLRLAVTPAEQPNIVMDKHFLYRATHKLDFEEIEEGTDDVRTRAPLLAFRQRINTTERATKLQLAYHTMHKRFVMKTQVSQRLDLARQSTHKDKAGSLCAYIVGLVSDYAESVDGRITRICLIAPTVCEDPYRPFNTKNRPVDSHLWLQADKIRMHGDYGDPNDPNPAVHGKPEDYSGDIRIGDMLIIAGRLNVYRDKNGHRKIGVDEWTPLSRTILYAFTYADNHSRLYHVPRHTIKRMRLLKINKDATVLWADPHMLGREIARWSKRWPNLADDMVLYSDRIN